MCPLNPGNSTLSRARPNGFGHYGISVFHNSVADFDFTNRYAGYLLRRALRSRHITANPKSSRTDLLTGNAELINVHGDNFLM